MLKIQIYTVSPLGRGEGNVRYGSEADVTATWRVVGFVPIADIAPTFILSSPN
jgi:hypothetical protein